MEKETTIFGLNPQKLARLLNIGSDTGQSEDQVDQEQRRVELFQDWLAATLPLDAVVVEALPAVLRRLCDNLQPLAGEPFGDLLQDPKVDIMVVKAIKDYGKKMAMHAKSEAEHDAATAIYYAAIASAILFHKKKLTTYSYKSLEESFEKLAGEKWIPGGMAELFDRARKACQDKAKGK